MNAPRTSQLRFEPRVKLSWPHRNRPAAHQSRQATHDADEGTDAMIERRYFLLASILLSACASSFGDSSSPAGSIASVGNGSFALAPGETRLIQIGGFYREFRVCNDTGSKGTLEFT